MKFLNNQIKALTVGLVLITNTACNQQHADNQDNIVAQLTQFVDPFIGTSEHGHVFLGANVPFGFVQLGPTNISQGWDWCSGYHYSDSTIIGFAHTHLSGTGIGDLGDISIMPVTGNVKLQRGTIDNPESGIASLFKHENEIAKPGFYSVYLDRFNVKAELTATKRVGFHKYTFQKSSDSKIIFDLQHGIGWDQLTEGNITQENDSTISGYRFSKGWANNQKIFFTAIFSKPVKTFQVETVQHKNYSAPYGIAAFDTDNEETIFLKVALSPVSIQNAKLNLQAELPHWNFQQTVENADNAWNQELNKIQFHTNDTKNKRIFYTALYHTMVAPSEFCDVNNDYLGADQTVYTNVAFVNYTTLSLWDTYRAAHPLLTIIHPEKLPDIINTFLHIYQQQGKLPVWHLMANETNCMVGNPAIPVVADAILKGFQGFDIDLAYDAMRTSALLNERGQTYLHQYGYIPFDKDNESVAKTMEYAIANWCVAQVAKKLGKSDDYQHFLRLSNAYQYFFDPTVGFMRGKDSNENFRTPFDPFKSVHGQHDYTEGTAWQYTWLVPHDVDGLVKLFGSKENFVSRLDSLFVVTGDMGSQASPDISGMIGQYAHGNEPGHHVPYLYAMVGLPNKTAEKVRYIMEHLYTDQHDGLCGNEDVGQMSAWYVLSALGLYQVEPAGGKYVLGSPIMDEAVINVGAGKTFQIIAKNNNDTNIYVEAVTLNGKLYDNFYIDHQTIADGGTLVFEMTNKPY